MIYIGGVHMANLTQKEQLLLQDQKSHEELCIKNIQITQINQRIHN